MDSPPRISSSTRPHDVSARPPGGPSPLDFHLARPGESLLAAARLSAATRSAYTERLLRASEIRQYVVLGAGLDISVWHLPAESAVGLADRGRVVDSRLRA
ncbi:hypothetical protein M2284_002102 [Rhodococcus sp. LBL1]|nr:hypothetical protein [Rhodococcus sp. LBL1]MDH6683490.1 hypothetical protein [Rhodococcus sp. LBL2]